MTEAEKLHTKKDVDFGTAFVSKTEGGKTTKYVIVVFKVNV